MYILKIDDIEIEIIKKKIRNINIRVYPPNGRVLISVPQKMKESQVKEIIVLKLDWIKRKRLDCSNRNTYEEGKYTTGDKILIWGCPKVLKVVSNSPKSFVQENADELILHITPKIKESTQRKKIIYEWYKEELKQEIEHFGMMWEKIIGEHVSEWRIKDMKTRWGTCNVVDRRIWINLHLVKIDPQFLEYVIVHEIVHLLEKSHNHVFKGYMDLYMPDWREKRKKLKKLCHQL